MMIRRSCALLLIVSLLLSETVGSVLALSTDGSAATWTREKAAHLANRAYYAATDAEIDWLLAAGSARAAVDLVFPDANGPDRTAFDAEIAAIVTQSGFAYDKSASMNVYYQMRYARDPYEAKAKLFGLFEDIFALNRRGGGIDYVDVMRHQDLLYRHTLGNYRTMVKRVLYNDGQPGDFAMGTFLNLLNGTDPNRPNENYARELMQLFTMGEYLPGESKESGGVRNYAESDVGAFARVITGFRSEASTKRVYYDSSKHNTGSALPFLTGALAPGKTFPFHNAETDTLDLVAMQQSIMGNDGLADNAVDYIYAKRPRAAALFLANRLYRFYVDETPSRADLDAFADVVTANDFEILPTVKWLLASDLMYSAKSMNSLRYKNPLEIAFGTAKLLHGGRPDAADPILRRADLLTKLGWTPYDQDSIFGRDGFDANFKFFTPYVYNQWVSYASLIANDSSTGSYSLDQVFSGRTRTVRGGSGIVSGTGYAYTGSLRLGTGTVSFVAAEDPVVAPRALLRSLADSVGESEISDADAVSAATGEVSDSGSLAGSGAMTDSGATGTGEMIPSSDAISDSDSTGTVVPPENSDASGGAVSETAPAVPGTGATSETWTTDPEATSGSVTPTASGAVSTPSSETPADTLSGAIADTGATVSEKSVSVETPAAPASVESAPEIPAAPEVPSIPAPVADPAPSVEIPAAPTASDLSFVSSAISAVADFIVPRAVAAGTGIVSTGAVVSSGAQSTGAVLTGATLTGVTLVLTGMTLRASGAVTLTIFSGAIAPDGVALVVSSGSYSRSGLTMPVYSWSFPILSGSLAQSRTASELVDDAARFLLPSRTLPTDVRQTLVDYLATDNSGATVAANAVNPSYVSGRLRGLVGLILSQPEYLLVSGYDQSPATHSSDSGSPIDGARGKLVIVQLFGGYDWLHGMVQKSDYDRLAAMRTSARSGTIMEPRSDMIDLGDYYLASAFRPLVPLIASGNVKIFNRVGGANQDSNHETAQRQMSSYDDTTAMFSDGVVGSLVKNEAEASKTIAIAAGDPDLYRGANFVSIGSADAQIQNYGGSVPQASRTRYVATIRSLLETRSFPSGSTEVFRNALKIHDVVTVSRAHGGGTGAGYSVAENFAFLENLLDSDVGQIFYINGQGGFDTHAREIWAPGEVRPNPWDKDLNEVVNAVATNVAKFFDDVKDKQDVTIVVFSEFGRTIAATPDRGTDHGQAGGMIVLTNNARLRQALPETVYGNISLASTDRNYMRVGIGYRSVYGAIYQSLYGLDPSAFFGGRVSLADDLSVAPATFSRIEPRYEALSDSQVRVNLSVGVDARNLDMRKAGYVKVGTLANTSTGAATARDLSDVQRKAYIATRQVAFVQDLAAGRSMTYRVEAMTDQYVPSVLTGSFTAPRIVTTRAGGPLPGGATGAILSPRIDPTADSVIQAYRGTAASGTVTLAGSGLLLAGTATGTQTVTLRGRSGVEWTTGTGATYVSSVFGSGTVWNGGFILGDAYDPDGFVGSGGLSTASGTVSAALVRRIAKIGADTPGVGMNLSQSVTVALDGVPPSSGYDVYRSEDGVTWENITAGSPVRSDPSGRVSFRTDRFSYFAVVSTTAACAISSDVSTAPVGSSAVLSYSAANASTASISPGIGSVSVSAPSSTGSVVVAVPSGLTRYVMTLDGNPATSCSVTVTGTSGGTPSSPTEPSVPSVPTDTSAASPNSGGGSGGLPPSMRPGAPDPDVIAERERAAAAASSLFDPNDSPTRPTLSEPERQARLDAAVRRALGIDGMENVLVARTRLTQARSAALSRAFAELIARSPESVRASRAAALIASFERVSASLPTDASIVRALASIGASLALFDAPARIAELPAVSVNPNNKRNIPRRRPEPQSVDLPAGSTWTNPSRKANRPNRA